MLRVQVLPVIPPAIQCEKQNESGHHIQFCNLIKQIDSMMLQQYAISLVRDSIIESKTIVPSVVDDNAKTHSVSTSFYCYCPSCRSQSLRASNTDSVVCLDANCETVPCPPLRRCRISDTIRRSNMTVNNDNGNNNHQKQERQHYTMSPSITLPPPVLRNPSSPPSKKHTSSLSKLLQSSPLRLPTRRHSFDESDLTLAAVLEGLPTSPEQMVDRKPVSPREKKNRSLDDINKFFVDSSPRIVEAGETPRHRRKKSINVKSLSKHSMDFTPSKDCMNNHMQIRLKDLIMHQSLPFTEDFVYENINNNNNNNDRRLLLIDSISSPHVNQTTSTTTGVNRRQRVYPSADTSNTYSGDVAPRPPRRQDSTRRLISDVIQ